MNRQIMFLLVALAGEAIIGTASVSASSKKRMEHIGEIGISIFKTVLGLWTGQYLDGRTYSLGRMKVMLFVAWN